MLKIYEYIYIFLYLVFYSDLVAHFCIQAVFLVVFMYRHHFVSCVTGGHDSSVVRLLPFDHMASGSNPLLSETRTPGKIDIVTFRKMNLRMGRERTEK